MFALRHIAAFAAAFALVPAAALANVSSDAQGLINQGQAAQALQQLDSHLAKNPQDAEARFTRGLALVQLNRSADAIRAFADLTRDYPQLPEPYNNLAVLYAAQGDYEKAREALQAALATNPSYATAHENLGDIYAALAGAAYNRALQLNDTNPMLRRKLALLNEIDPGTVVRAPVAQQPVAVTTAAPTVAATAPPVSTPAVTASAPPTAEPASPSPQATDLQPAIESAIQAWANAWSAQNVAAYLLAYDADFTPEGGVSRAAWEAQRRERIAAPGSISVKVGAINIETTGENQVRASFAQQYASDNYSDSTQKVLELKRAEGAWKITREYNR